MRPRDRQVFVLNRREFCIGACAAAAAATAPGCLDGGSGAIQTGPLGPDAGAYVPGQPDARPGAPDARPGQPDAHTPVDTTPDAAPPDPGPTCPSGVTNVGAPSSFVLGTATYFSSGDFFVVRDSGGLYALTSICTHNPCTVNFQGSQFHCPCHGATFSLNGSVISGPAFLPLKHYAMCTLAGGNVGVDRSTVTSSGDRLAI